MFRNVEIPHGCWWSTPFARWQGSFATLHSMEFAAWVARAEMERRALPTTIFDHAVLGLTTPQRSSFQGTAWFMSLLGAPNVAGPHVAQACATGTRALVTAAQETELGFVTTTLALCADRTSNGPVLLYNDSGGPGGGRPEMEQWITDGFAGRDKAIPYNDGAVMESGEKCAARWSISTAEQHDVVLRRYQQYQDAVANDHAFQKRYMTLPFPVPNRSFQRVVGRLDGDEGVFQTSAEKLAALKPIKATGTLTYAGQTHPADGNAAMIVTSAGKARELARDKAIRIRLLSFGAARGEQGYMPAAPVPAARQALERAGLSLDQMDAVKSHNPFVVNDIIFARETGFDVNRLNNYGSPLIWGHTHGSTAMRAIIELIEELVLRGGGTGLFQGCAAGDVGMAAILKVDAQRA